MIGEHTVELIPDPTGTGTRIDLSCLVDEVAIHHGRDDTGSQPEASSSTVDISLDTGETPLPGLEIGSFLEITTTTELVASVRFRGRITDIAYSWQAAGEDTPDRLDAQVIAVGTLADLGRRTVGDVPFPQELDGARVARVLNLAGVTLDPSWSDPGTVQILARDVDSQPALDVCQATADSAGGIVWSTRTGEVRYADAVHRRGTPTALELDACDILVTPQWTRTTEGLINGVSIGYGTAADGGEQPRYVAQDDASIARYGSYSFVVATLLALLDDATALGRLLLVQNSSPVWILSTLPVDVKGLDPERTVSLLGLDVHSLITVTGLPIAGGAPTSAALFVEGWSETLFAGGHEIELVVSGYCRTVPPPRWDDVPPSLTWDGAPGSWDDWACVGPQPNLGRWTDVPASTRWNQVPPATTWDTWK